MDSRLLDKRLTHNGQTRAEPGRSLSATPTDNSFDSCPHVKLSEGSVTGLPDLYYIEAYCFRVTILLRIKPVKFLIFCHSFSLKFNPSTAYYKPGKIVTLPFCYKTIYGGNFFQQAKGVLFSNSGGLFKQRSKL